MSSVLAIVNAVLVLALQGAVFGAPVLLIVGWWRIWLAVYGASPLDPPRGLCCRLSIAGFASCTVAFLIYILAMFAETPPASHLWEGGALVAAAGFAPGLLGVWGRGPVRWLTPICAIGVWFYFAGPY